MTTATKKRAMAMVLGSFAVLGMACQGPDATDEQATVNGETSVQALNLGSGEQWPKLYGEDGARYLPCGPGRACRVELPQRRHDAPGRLIEVRAWSGKYIDGIEFTWQTNDGRIVKGSAGTKGGSESNPEVLQPGEFIVRIEGGAGKYVDWLRIHTNMRSFPMWGGGGGGYFDVDLGFTHESPDGPRREIHGFLTRSGKYLDQIGFIHYGP